METIPLWLAVHDFIPVLVAGAGLGAVTVAVGRTHHAASLVVGVGAGLVVTAGLAKASAKLVAALGSGTPPPVLDEALFPLLAPGMVTAALGLAARHGRLEPLVPGAALWAPVLVWAAAGTVAATAGWDAAKPTLIGLATIGNVAIAVLLIRWARSAGRPRAAWLFGANLAVVLALAGMARAVEQTVAWQWVEQNLNLAAQLAFLIGAATLVAAGRQSGASPPLDVSAGGSNGFDR
jgi:hypothetical protein